MQCSTAIADNIIYANVLLLQQVAAVLNIYIKRKGQLLDVCQEDKAFLKWIMLVIGIHNFSLEQSSPVYKPMLIEILIASYLTNWLRESAAQVQSY